MNQNPDPSMPHKLEFVSVYTPLMVRLTHHCPELVEGLSYYCNLLGCKPAQEGYIIRAWMRHFYTVPAAGKGSNKIPQLWSACHAKTLIRSREEFHIYYPSTRKPHQ